MGMGPLSCNGHLPMRVFSRVRSCVGGVEACGPGPQGKLQGWDRSLCLPFPPQASATPWPLSLKNFSVWPFSPLTLIKT